MKRLNIKNFVLALMVVFAFGCEDVLDSPPYAELAPDNVLSSQKGIEALLYSSYDYQYFGGQSKDWVNISECMTDLALIREGGEAGNVAPFSNWTWDYTTPWINNSLWVSRYRSIREANLVIANVDGLDAEQSVKNRILAEARYLRAANYAMLYNLFGPVPLRMSPSEPGDKPRASDEEMLSFIETELDAVVEDLPHPDSRPSGYEYGRATKGSALGYLTKHYLNTRQWQKAAETAQRLMDLDYYELFPDFPTMFMVQNENSPEMVVPFPCTNEANTGGYQNNWFNGAMSQDFLSSPKIPQFERVLPVGTPWPTNFSVRDWVVDSFEEGDTRKNLIVDEYTATNGETKNYRDQRPDNARNMKFFDPNAKGAFHGNDFPYIRFADILLSRAEALNEMSGPNSESVDLLNDVRVRAGVSQYTLGDFASKEELRDAILQERVWEFLSEGKRREDLLRHNMLVSNAQERGIGSAVEYRRVFPIPQNEADTNMAIEQNEGY
ncbi:RagB/SusD family nutrient uptake outer membrane protein [Marinilabilia rubra]|uniref:RagB/SusD family nutrient uptake outer membrane protein n=1 Tax=Marinilabilia rubra TaxID=2162893 RepID=A0A2U2B650_9BACT|nr:RagB/SusD family nutrient uptake outer membrane protein [Marinilabilia rubra]PWD98513.1 RagB/SusD family nutrient uptake outer membrane protein [Marinilabilia rubra]